MQEFLQCAADESRVCYHAFVLVSKTPYTCFPLEMQNSTHTTMSWAGLAMARSVPTAQEEVMPVAQSRASSELCSCPEKLAMIEQRA